jgi:HSP20 family molecular chaperone IbpA
MMDKLFRGFGDDSDIFKEFEQMFDQSLSDRLGASPRTLGFQGPANFGMDWMESAKGRTLVITPTSKGQALDINVDGRAVTVKGKSEAKSEFGSSVSSFSNSFPVPEDCDASKVKIEQDKEKILVFFPFSGKAPGTERSPLPSTGNDVRI